MKPFLANKILPTCIAALACIAAWSLFWSDGTKILDNNSRCETPQYKVRILSFDPFMMHIENFLSQREILHLLDAGKPLFRRSQVNSKDVVSPGRTSSTATLPVDDPIARCISSRAAEIQGFVPVESVERLQITRYQRNEQYRQHYDWSFSGTRDNERISTFFAILEADCIKCGTQFPELMINATDRDGRWCEFIECESEGLLPLTIKALAGNAFYWRNLFDDGTGDERTLHAGLPVVKGSSKIGLNIWTRQSPIER